MYIYLKKINIFFCGELLNWKEYASTESNAVHGSINMHCRILLFHCHVQTLLYRFYLMF